MERSFKTLLGRGGSTKGRLGPVRNLPNINRNLYIRMETGSYRPSCRYRDA
jgi:hypothetical protein